MTDRLLTYATEEDFPYTSPERLAEATGVRESTIRRMAKAGVFPGTVKLAACALAIPERSDPVAIIRERAHEFAPTGYDAAVIGKIAHDALMEMKPRTRENYAAALKRFASFAKCSIPEAGELVIDPLLGKQRLMEWRQSMLEECLAGTLKRSTVNNFLAGVMHITRWCARAGLCDAAQDIPLLPMAQNVRRRGQDAGTTAKLMAALMEDAIKVPSQANLRALAVASLIFSGLRIAEATTFKIGDFDREGKRLLTRVKGGSGAEREVLLPDNLVALLGRILDKHPERHSPSAYLLAGRYGAPMHRATFLRHLRATVERHKIEVGPKALLSAHGLRHTAATVTIKTCGLEAAQALLGHKNMSTTLIYDDGKENRALTAANALQSALGINGSME